MNYEGLYEVSNYGQVRKISGRIKKLSKTKAGYLVTGFRKEGKNEIVYVHRLVASAFLQPIPNTEVNHRDGNKQRNHVGNLEWVTRKENIHHAFKNGLNKVNTKLSIDQVNKMAKMYATGLYIHEDLAMIFNVSAATVSRYLKNAKERFSLART